LLTASCDRTLKLWEKDKTALFESTLTLKGHRAAVNACFMDDKHIVSGSADCTILVWNKKTGEKVTFYGDHRDEILAVQPFLNNLLMSASYDGTIKIWPYLKDMSKEKALFDIEAHTKRINSVQVNENKIATCGWDRGVKLLEFSLDIG